MQNSRAQIRREGSRDRSMDRCDHLRGGRAGGSRLGTVVRLRTVKLTLTGGGERVRRARSPKEVGRRPRVFLSPVLGD